MREETSRLSLQGWLIAQMPAGWSGKTSPEFCRAGKAAILPPSYRCSSDGKSPSPSGSGRRPDSSPEPPDADIRGRERLEGVTVSEVDEKRNPIPGTEIEFDCDTLLLSCGLIPENELSLGAGVEISPATSGAVVNESFETSVPGIFACGNVLHVHDLVDHVSNESFKAGAAAAAYVRNETRRGSVIAVRDGDGVRGTVPQQIRSDTDQPVDLMFRPSAVFRNSSVVVESGAQELIRKKAMIFTPGEMALVTLRPEMLKNIGSDSITVRIERN